MRTLSHMLLQVTQILLEGEGERAHAAGVRLADGRAFRARAVISNATRWDTFERLLPPEDMPRAERLFRRAHALIPPGTCNLSSMASRMLGPGTAAAAWARSRRGLAVACMQAGMQHSVHPDFLHMLLQRRLNTRLRASG
jgi:prolycopene isomerase